MDGGIADSIPLRKCIDLGYDKIIVVLTRPLDYRKKPSSTALFKWFYRKYPKLIERWQNRYAEYNQSVEQVIKLQEQQKIFVIRPSQTLDISRLEKNPDKLKAMYQLGLNDARQLMSSLKSFLSEKK